MATDEQKNIEDMFGSDSESEEDTFKGSSAKPSAVNESTSGLFGSDSESEEDEKPKKLKKTTKSASKPPKPAKRKVSARAADDDEGAERRAAQPRRDDGDEYDSGDEVVRTKDDDAFIDDEDDLGGVLDEYDQDNQNFDDERPDDEGDRFTSRHEDDYFEETLKSMKTGRGRSKLKMSQQEIETLVQELLYNMDKAYNDDQVAMEDKKPALQKLKLVNSVLLLARKHQLQLPLLDFDFLGVVKKWIQPMENGLLPNIGLRTKMIEMCQTLPIDKEHLKRSGFGKVIMALWKHPHETPENKEICRQLIDRWSRSVFSKTLDFTKLSELEAEKREANGGVRPTIDRRPANQRNVESVRNRGFLNRGNTATDSINSSSRVRMPEQIRIDFTLRPQPKVDASQIPSTKVDPESKKARLMKRMQIIARPTKRAKRAVKMSIEGRGLQS